MQSIFIYVVFSFIYIGNALQQIFPHVKHFLCIWHIQKDVLARCKKEFEESCLWDYFYRKWFEVMYSESEQIYAEKWNALEEFLQGMGKVQVINYLQRTWLPYKEKFVSAWTRKHTHYGQCSTSRVEGEHRRVKNYIEVHMMNCFHDFLNICAFS
jgi:hypothetical protein